MRYRRLGGTGLIVSEPCLGTMTFGNGEGRLKRVAGVDQTGADAPVERSLAAGINLFDTADVYSRGESEQILGRSLKTIGVKRSDVIIATKVSSDVGAGPNERVSCRGHIIDSVADSLDRLGVDHIDLYQIHHQDPLTPEDETLRTRSTISCRSEKSDCCPATSFITTSGGLAACLRQKGAWATKYFLPT